MTPDPRTDLMSAAELDLYIAKRMRTMPPARKPQRDSKRVEVRRRRAGIRVIKRRG